jgi:hypothetical protein
MLAAPRKWENAALGFPLGLPLYFFEMNPNRTTTNNDRENTATEKSTVFWFVHIQAIPNICQFFGQAFFAPSLGQLLGKDM